MGREDMKLHQVRAQRRGKPEGGKALKCEKGLLPPKKRMGDEAPF